MSSVKKEFIEYLVKEFPGLSSEPLNDLISDNLLSPYKIQLPKKALDQGQEAIRGFYKLRESAEYQQLFEKQLSELGLKDPGNKAIMMSYDFHLDSEGNLKLIEVNTNAAFLILGQLLYACRKVTPPVSNFSLLNLKDSIQEELHHQNKKIMNPKVSIVDENPVGQRLFIEFLTARELIKSWGWPCEIADVSHALESHPDFIYNRYTDFYLTQPTSQKIRQAFLDRKVCLSPHPFEYFLLADKKRLSEWSQGVLDRFPLVKKSVESVLLKSWPLNENTKEEIWSRRKQLFFKPSQDFGSKGSFKGSSISRKAFDELAMKDSLAQEYVPAPELRFDTESGPQSYKFDLRFYAYKDRLQSVMARLYQGQTTNLRTPGGGFACVEFM